MAFKTSAGERQVIRLDKLSDRPMINNKVLVRVDFIPEDGHVMKRGELELELAGGEFNESVHMARFGTVVNKPLRLIYRGNHEPQNSFQPIEWQTDVEVEEGDTVYFGVMASANAVLLEIAGDIYYILDYGDLILRVRDGEIRPLNGYVLCEEVVEETRIDGLILDFGKFQDKRLGVVKYVGTPNTAYFASDATDADVEVGDRVVFRGDFWTGLEEEMFAHLNEKLGYVQGQWIIAKL